MRLAFLGQRGASSSWISVCRNTSPLKIKRLEEIQKMADEGLRWADIYYNRLTEDEREAFENRKYAEPAHVLRHYAALSRYSSALIPPTSYDRVAEVILQCVGDCKRASAVLAEEFDFPDKLPPYPEELALFYEWIKEKPKGDRRTFAVYLDRDWESHSSPRKALLPFTSLVLYHDTAHPKKKRKEAPSDVEAPAKKGRKE
jgi:hypothetical protein